MARGTQAHEFLAVLDSSPQLGSTELRRLLETDETQVSRTGRRLLDSGLVTRRKVGRQVFWQLSPRGHRALVEAPEQPEPTPPDGDSFWAEAIRRGFEGAAGEEPGQPRREVDPTRERIIECTLELHMRAGHPGDHVAGDCRARGGAVGDRGGHVPHAGRVVPGLRSALPGEPRHASAGSGRRTMFAGASSEQERIRRLVETSFGVYERGADGIAVGRRERAEVPAADESMGHDRQLVRRARRRGAAPAASRQLLGGVRAGPHRPRGVAHPAGPGRHARGGCRAGQRRRGALARGTSGALTTPGLFHPGPDPWLAWHLRDLVEEPVDDQAVRRRYFGIGLLLVEAAGVFV